MKIKKNQRILVVALSPQLTPSCMGPAAFATDAGDRFEKDGLTCSVLTAPPDNAPGAVQIGNGWGSLNLSKSPVLLFRKRSQTRKTKTTQWSLLSATMLLITAQVKPASAA